MGGFRAAGAAAAAVTALGVVGLAAPSYADSTVPVQGTAFPDPARANLSFVGCGDLYQRTDESLAPSIGVGPGVAPAGTRSLGWDLAGGNAVGAAFPVDSMLTTTTASMAVNSSARASGVAYAGYQAPADAGTELLWIGRAPLITPGGAWQTVDATTRTYTWTKYDMSTHQPVVANHGAEATVATFAAAHGGDGPGIYTIGFGCDGVPFSMDALRVGPAGAVTTYDIEALRTTVSIAVDPGPGDDVTISGRMNTVTGDPVPHATMVLERRTADSQAWKPVAVADLDADGRAKVTVPRTEAAFYRWRFVERPLAEGSTSLALLVDVLPPHPTPSGTPTDTPTPSPTGAPTPSPSDSPTASDPPTTSDAPTPSDSGSPSATSSDSPSDPSPSATDSGSPSTSSPSGSGDESGTPSESDSHGTR